MTCRSSLRARVTSLQIGGSWQPVDGGSAISVAGTVTAPDQQRWYAGAELEAPVTFRRPPRYFNDGVADAEVARAWRGVTVLGSVKSGLLVEVRAPGQPGRARRRSRSAGTSAPQSNVALASSMPRRRRS